MNITPGQIDPDAAKVVLRLRHFGHAAYLVGGCVRDLLLGLRPKDFDVATSATPNEIRRVFRNCRIIGRRFRLAHIFFGSKIIETSTFRKNPRTADDDEPAENGAPGANDLLIRRDNVFGTAEEDARRRDFTINGLFFDLDTNQVIDYVGGQSDIEARVVRTIGDPDIRFREDPVRILRAVRFAARCNLTIEPETYRRMMEHAGEIAKSAQARVSEDFYRLLRAGAAKRSMEMLLESRLLDVLIPELAAPLRRGDADEGAHDAGELRQPAPVAGGQGNPAGVPVSEGRRRVARFWAYFAALDRSTTRRDSPPSNALALATLLLPPLRDVLHPDTNAVRDIGQLIQTGSQPIFERIKASRRDGELARQILLALRYIFPSSNPRRRRPRLAGGEFLDHALRLHEIVSDAESSDPSLVGTPLLAEGSPPPPDEEPLPPELAASAGRDRYGRRERPPESPRPERPAVAANGTAERPPTPRGQVRTPIPDLAALSGRPASRPAFLGTGRFARWGDVDR